ncbi:cytochrome c maturation protein CcmE [Photorhabdus luminescens]|uniref:cytochrome c maturation protein CcmE n=1 Tax=Photorhabdus akhurstii TaxID=171438 RepID=UPI000CF9E688|nr:cytochrome c maturation protein CcmE [Photorhabdus luminescens]PQQ27533.1 cytochrome c maturation protein CcmE [Photorhabdus luminescens]
MNSRRKTRLYLVIITFMGLCLTVTMIFYALRANIDLFYTPGEILYGKGSHLLRPTPGQRLRIGGTVMPGSIVWDDNDLKVSFKLYDTQGVVDISYEGILPDLFREGQGIVALGVLGNGNHITAQEILAKHDENYMPPEVKAAMEQN